MWTQMVCFPVVALSRGDKLLNVSVTHMATLLGELITTLSYIHSIVWLSLNIVKWLNLLQMSFLSLYMLCLNRKDNVFYFFIALYISSVTEILWHLLNIIFSTIVLRLNIIVQPMGGNYDASGKTDQQHGRSFIISIIVIPCIISYILMHKEFTMKQDLTYRCDRPSISVTVSCLLSRNYRPYIWRRLTSLEFNCPRQFPNLMSFIRIMVTNFGPI